LVQVIAVSVETLDDGEMEQEWLVPVPELLGALETALATVRVWMGGGRGQ
jgi:hypothetical protein